MVVFDDSTISTFDGEKFHNIHEFSISYKFDLEKFIKDYMDRLLYKVLENMIVRLILITNRPDNEIIIKKLKKPLKKNNSYYK
jgi:hypothetical protein